MEPNKSRNTNSNGFPNCIHFRNKNPQSGSILDTKLKEHDDLVDKFAKATGIHIVNMKSQMMATCSNDDGQRFWIMSCGHSEFKPYQLINRTLTPPEPAVIPSIKIRIINPTNRMVDINNKPTDSHEENPLPNKEEKNKRSDKTDYVKVKRRIKPEPVDEITSPPHKKSKQKNNNVTEIEGEPVEVKEVSRRSKRIQKKINGNCVPSPTKPPTEYPNRGKKR